MQSLLPGTFNAEHEASHSRSSEITNIFLVIDRCIATARNCSVRFESRLHGRLTTAPLCLSFAYWKEKREETLRQEHEGTRSCLSSVGCYGFFSRPILRRRIQPRIAAWSLIPPFPSLIWYLTLILSYRCRSFAERFSVWSISAKIQRVIRAKGRPQDNSFIEKSLAIVQYGC